MWEPLRKVALQGEAVLSGIKGLEPEIERIFTDKSVKTLPFYIFEARADVDVQPGVSLLLEALLIAKRLKSRKYMRLWFEEYKAQFVAEIDKDVLPYQPYFLVYRGDVGAVIVTVKNAKSIENAYKLACEYQKSTLTIFHIPPSLRGKLMGCIGDMPTVTFKYDEAEDNGGGSVEELEGLIGLTETKTTVTGILNYARARELYADAGIDKKLPMHMIFTGNPGTAKTTVARLIARILSELGIIQNAELTEVGRADLVGQYVGWTATQVREVFEKADGGVLFIDEAYSLADGKNSFGDEAINTIVQEMENRRDRVIVIFAGYPEEMGEFLNRNPGLRSRINFHVNFPDYSPAELYDILTLLTTQDGFYLADDVRDKVYPMLERAVRGKDFGNGRYVRNLLERALMRQATRLVSATDSRPSDEEVKTLTAVDFEDAPPPRGPEKRRIGFR
jgi:AAA+ superfamily predicted ATPase